MILGFSGEWPQVISPQSELGAFYFCPGVLSGYCCVCESGYCNRVCYRGSSQMCQIWVQWWHFWRLLVTVDFDDSFNTKVWSVDHIIIVIYINGVSYRGSSEMCQIWVQWWHFWRLLVTVDFDGGINTKVWSVDHIIIVMVINDVCYRRSSEMCQIWVQCTEVVTLLEAVCYCWFWW